MPLSTLRILVLEDPSSQRCALIQTLRALSCAHIIEAADGSQALKALEQQGAVDIALCDLCINSMEGLAFLRRAGQQQLAGAVIISSELAPDLLQTVGQMLKLLGMQLLGVLAKNTRPLNLKPLMDTYILTALPKLDKPAPTSAATDAEVIKAMQNGQFEVHYQPKFSLQNLEVDSLEALARWEHPRLGLLGPSQFLSALKRLGLLDQLLHQQIDQCLRFREQAKGYGFDFKFSINIQTFQLANDQLFSDVSKRLNHYRAPGDCLCFEMTESESLALTPVNLENLIRLRMIGCGLSIDDFGAGHSSLQRLCSLPFNEIKLDGMFVRGLNVSARSSVAIASTLQLADALGISVVVEGIETPEQHNFLLHLGCKVGQGYFFARPMSSAKLLIWLFNKNIQDHFSTIRDRLLCNPLWVRSTLSL